MLWLTQYWLIDILGDLKDLVTQLNASFDGASELIETTGEITINVQPF